MPVIYIPPREISFRLVGSHSNSVLFSRTHAEPEVYHHRPPERVYPDHWFQLVPGTGRYASYYLIKSKHTGKVLFSRTTPIPTVGHTDGDGAHDDNWFCIEPGTGRNAKCFRLRNLASDTVLFSRTDFQPEVGNCPANMLFDDHYFTFLFEDMKVNKVVFLVEEGRIVSSTLKMISEQTFTNVTDVTQNADLHIHEQVDHAHNFEYASGFPATNATVHLPYVAQGKISVDTSTSHPVEWGKPISISKTYSTKYYITALPRKTVRVLTKVTVCQIEVPFRIHLESSATGFVVETYGTHRGITSWNLEHEILSASN
ncbi:hemolytic lectin LSLb [Serendipita vermifera]|nr:hemolytic lectin LSLb [Serendipita vermifera]